MATYGIFGWEKRTAPSAPGSSITVIGGGDARALFGGGMNSFAGEVVNIETALSCVPVWAAVNFIAQSIAALPLNYFKTTKDGRVRAVGTPLQKLVHDIVNIDYETSFDWRVQMMTSVLMKGRAYTFIQRTGPQIQLFYADIEYVQPFRDENFRLKYRYTLTGKVYDPKDVIDIAWNRRQGGLDHFNPLAKLANACGLAIGAERYASYIFESGGVPAMALEVPEDTSPNAVARASKQMNEAVRRSRAEKSQVVLIPANTKLTAVGFDPSKTQMLEIQKFQIIQIARFFGLPPIFLQDLSSGTYSNTEQQDLNFMKHTLNHWIQRWEPELNAKLSPRGGLIEFNVDGLLRGDFTTRMTGASIAVQNGIRTPNEIRAMENLPALPGGDRLFINSASVPLESVDVPTTNDLNAPNPVTEPDDDDSGESDD